MVVAKDRDRGRKKRTTRLLYAKQLLPSLGQTIKEIAVAHFWHHFKPRFDKGSLTPADRDDPVLNAMLQAATSPGVCHLFVNFFYVKISVAYKHTVVCSALVVKLLPAPKGDGRGKARNLSERAPPKRPDLRISKGNQPPERVKAVIEALTTAQILTDVLIEAFRLTCPPGFNRVWRELLWRKPGVDQVAFAIITVV